MTSVPILSGESLLPRGRYQQAGDELQKGELTNYLWSNYNQCSSRNMHNCIMCCTAECDIIRVTACIVRVVCVAFASKNMALQVTRILLIAITRDRQPFVVIHNNDETFNL